MKLQRIASDRTGHIVLYFGDGNCLSLLLAMGSHTENYRIEQMFKDNPLDWFNAPVGSTTLEIMPSGETLKNICESYDEYWNDRLLNYFPVELFPELLNKILNA